MPFEAIGLVGYLRLFEHSIGGGMKPQPVSKRQAEDWFFLNCGSYRLREEFIIKCIERKLVRV